MKKLLFVSILRYFIICIELLYVHSAWAWSPVGHQLVAQIAYKHLSEHARARVLNRIELWDQRPADVQSFDRAAAWADLIKGSKVRIFNSWHYIEHPYVVKGEVIDLINEPSEIGLVSKGSFESKTKIKAKQIRTNNIVTAIQQAIVALKVQRADPLLQAFFLRMLIHLVGDIHQPLHCISRYSVHTPKGDLGGNRFPIAIKGVRNLHAYWDRGLGLFPKPLHKQIDHRWVVQYANKISERYPPAFFGTRLENNNVMKWSWDSYQLARNTVYHTPWGQVPSADYRRRGQALVEQQLALAGYRLARILEDL